MATKPEDLAQRLRKVYKEIDEKGFDPLDVIYAHGSGIDALAYGALLWPTFVEYRGMVVRAMEWADNDGHATLDAALDRHGGDRQRAEESVNWTDIGDLFGPRKLESSDDDDLVLARLLRDTWAARLRQLYPAKRFAVEINSDEADEGLAVGFWQVET